MIIQVVNGFLSAGGGIDSSPHRYWRIKVTAQNLGSTFGYIAATEIEMHTSVGGADQCSGGTALADSAFAPASNAFDNNTVTWWACNGSGNNAYIGYDFGSGNDKNIVEMSWTNRASDGDWQVPTDVTIDYSSDGSSWTVKWSETGLFWSGATTTVTMVP